MLVLRKLRGPPATASMEMQTLENVIGTLFPANPSSRYRYLPASKPPVPFTTDEVNAAVERACSKIRHQARTVSTEKSSRQSAKLTSAS